MKNFFVLFILTLLYFTSNAQTYLPKIENSDAHDKYCLKGTPQSLYHRTYEIARDSLTGELIVGNELDYISELSYRINFTENGNVQDFHYIHDGRATTSLSNFFDPEGRYCTLQIEDNIPTSYQRNWIDNYKEPQYNQGYVYQLIQEEYAMSYFGDSLLLTSRDTTHCIEKDNIILSLFVPETDNQYDNYPIKDSNYYAHYIDSCRNNVIPQNRTLNLYNEKEQLSVTIEYTPISKHPSFIEYFYYDKNGMLTLNKRLSYVTFDESGEVIYISAPLSDIFRYEYPEDSIDQQGNWTKRYVFRQFRKEKEQPLYLECRQIDYIK